jgi:hypothetical protein
MKPADVKKAQAQIASWQAPAALPSPAIDPNALFTAPPATSADRTMDHQ